MREAILGVECTFPLVPDDQFGHRELSMAIELVRRPGGEQEMQLRVQEGDRLVLPALRVGGVTRTAVVVEVLGEEGLPPFLLQWDDGSQTIVFPSNTTYVERADPEAEN